MPGRRDLLIAAALAAATCLSRLPFVGEILYHWDSVNFALALHWFDVAASQPHVPGYPLYVLLGRAVFLALPEAQKALAAISVAGGGLAVGSLYLLGVEMFGRGVALVAALLLASSPLYWFYGEIALPHSLDAFVVVSAVWLLYRVARGQDHLLLPAAIWLGVAGGLRPQTQIFLMPVAVFAVWRGWPGWRRGGRRVAAALFALVFVDLLWFVPLVLLTGGLENYLRLTREFYLTFNRTTSIVSGGGLWGLQRNLIKLTMYTLYGWAAGLPLLLLGLIKARTGLLSRLRQNALLTGLLALWIVPTVAYYQFIHMGQQGLVFVFLPALCLFSAAALAPFRGAQCGRSPQPSKMANPLVANLSGRPRFCTFDAWSGLAAIAIVGNAAIFLFAPTFPLGGDRPKLLTVETLRQHDAYYRNRIAATRARFDPQHTVVLSSGWRFAQFYLDEYHLVPYAVVARWELGEGESQIKDTREFGPRLLGVRPDEEGLRYAVLLDDELVRFDADGERLESMDLADGGHLAFLRLRAGEGIRLQPDSFAIAPPLAAAAAAKGEDEP